MYSTRAVGRFECSRWGTWDWPSHISTILGECTCTVPGLSVALNVWGVGTWDWPSHISTILGECTCAVPGLSVALNVWGGDLRLAFTHFYYTW